MKKLFTFAAALLATLSMMAETATFTADDFASVATKTTNGITVSLATSVTVASQQTWKNNGSAVKENVIQIANSANQNHDVYYVEISSDAVISAVRFKAVHNQSGATTTYTFPVVSWEDTPAAAFDGVSLVTAPGKEATTAPDFIDYTPCTNAHYVRAYRIIRVNSDQNAFASSNYTALGDGKTIYISEIEVETGVAVTKHTVSYYDGETLLGTEKVVEGETPAKYADYQAKARHTFDGWFNEATFTTAADFTAAITADKSFYGKWTAEPMVYSSSFNFAAEAAGAKGDLKHLLDSVNISYSDNITTSGGWDTNNLYTGYKIKKNGAYLELGLQAGKYLSVVFGYVETGVTITIDGVAQEFTTSKTAESEFTYTATADCYVKIVNNSADSKTTTIKNIFIGEEPLFNNNTKLATLTLDGQAIAGFQAGKLSYSVELPNGTTTYPVVAATTEDANATISTIGTIAQLPDTIKFTVTAEDGTTTANYQIIFTEARPIVYLQAPYDVTNADFSTLPNWLHGNVVYNADYQGGDTTYCGHQVLRTITNTDPIHFYVGACDSLIIKVSATGGRTAQLAIGDSIYATKEVKKGAVYEIAAYIHSNATENHVVFSTPGANGGTTIFGIKLTEYNNVPTAVENIVEEKAIKVIENGQLIIIKNGVRYSATGMRL